MKKLTALSSYALASCLWLGAAYAGCTKDEVMAFINKGFDKQEIAALCNSEQSAPSNKAIHIRWRDHAVLYDAIFELDSEGAKISADLYDLETKRFIVKDVGRMTVTKIPRGVAFNAQFEVPWDSTTPKPHKHPVYLVFRQERDGSVNFVNCNEDADECYSGEVVQVNY